MPSSYIKPLKMLIHKISSNGEDLTVPLRHATQITIPHTSATSGNPLITYSILSRVENTDHFLLDLGGVTTRSGSDELQSNTFLDPYFLQRFDNSDYNATFNNAVEIDTATKLQKVDYSSGPIPTNLEAIRYGQADQAEVQEYLHGSLGMRTGRYLGKELTGAKVNEYTDGDTSYGKTAVLENKSIYFAYFNEIGEFNKELLDHVQADIRYIVDKEGTYRDITLESDDYFNLQQSFPEGKPTEVSLDSSTYLGFNMYSVNGSHRVRRSGATVQPIMFTHQSESALWPAGKTGYTEEVNFGDDPSVVNFRGNHVRSEPQSPTYVKKSQSYVVLFDKEIKQKAGGTYDSTTGEYEFQVTPDFGIYFNATFYFTSLDNSSRKERFEPIIEWYDTSDSTWKQVAHKALYLGGSVSPVSKADKAIIAGTAAGTGTGAAIGAAIGWSVGGILAIVTGGAAAATAPALAAWGAAIGGSIGAVGGAGAGALVRALALKDPYEFEVDGRSADNKLIISTADPESSKLTLRKKKTPINLVAGDKIRVRIYSKTGDFEIQRNSRFQILQEKNPLIPINTKLHSLGNLFTAQTIPDPPANSREYLIEDFDIILPSPFPSLLAGDTLSDALGMPQNSYSDGYTRVALPFDIQVGDEIRFNEDESRTHTITEVYYPDDIFEFVGVSGATYTRSGSLTFRVYPPIPSAYTGSNYTNNYTIRRFVPDPKSVILVGTKPSGSTSGGILKPTHITAETNETLKSILPNLRKDASSS